MKPKNLIKINIEKMRQTKKQWEYQEENKWIPKNDYIKIKEELKKLKIIVDELIKKKTD
jgi:hypothetical protein